MSNQLPEIACTIDNINQFIQEKESSLPLKPDNGSRIFWDNDSLKEKTPWCLLYLHGFSASWYEGEPTHRNFATRFGMNAYIPRLAEHGLETNEPLQNMTPDNLYESAKEALVIAHLLGNKVLIMGTSTGGTLALKLAAEFPEMIDGLILLSPNIRINNPKAFLLSGPWGLQIARKVYNSNYRVTNEDFECKECQYWNCKYRLEATVYLQQLIDATMNRKTFKKVKAPLFAGYYYKDETHQDDVVRVDAIIGMVEQVGTSAEQKRSQAFPEAGAHVIGGELFSGSLEKVQQACFSFAEEIVKLQPK
jgi:esterase/lipase